MQIANPICDNEFIESLTRKTWIEQVRELKARRRTEEVCESHKVRCEMQLEAKCDKLNLARS